jgi:hypothetical protein
MIFYKKGYVRESLSPCAVPVILVPKSDDTLRIGGVLMRNGCPVAYHSEKLDGTQLNYPIYDQELFALVHVLKFGNIIFGQKNLSFIRTTNL